MVSAIVWYVIPGMQKEYAASIFVSVVVQE
jgi:hypothetical protein